MILSSTICNLFRNLESEDVGVARAACRDAGLLLERHVFRRYDDEMYIGLLSSMDLFEIRLSAENYEKIVTRLGEILDRKAECADVAAWAAGKTMDPQLRRKLIIALQHYVQMKNDDFVYQLIISVENYGINKDEKELIGLIANSEGMPRSSAYANEILRGE